MGKIKHLKERVVETLKTEGPKALEQKTINYIKLRVNKSSKKMMCDVLFINGCCINAPSRYRVDHQIEQLNSYGMRAERVEYTALKDEMMKYHSVFIFYRCPITDTIREFIKKAKEWNKTIIYDVDDLVIDTKYTDQIEFLKTLSKDEKNLYDDGVRRMGETLKMCDYAITTTEALAAELKKYVPDVYVNRNVASERMAELSLRAIDNVVRDEDKIVLGYLSGSITHNPDFQLIVSALGKVMKKYPNVYLKVVGLVDVPETLKDYENRIISVPFTDWEGLPNLIASLDINLAPLEKSIFNDCKSENKWMEAALCKVVTIASNTGAFAKSISDNENGILCNDNEWTEKLDLLISNKELRNRIALNAFNYAIKNKVTTYSGLGLMNYIKSKMSKEIAFVLPSTNLSGGINVVLQHCCILRRHGYDITLFNMDDNSNNVVSGNETFGVLCYKRTDVRTFFDNMVATLWSTLDIVLKYPNALHKSYLVQGFETDFAKYGQEMKALANSTYNSFMPVNYLTVSKWCQSWLIEKYNKKAKYAPNGIKINYFPVTKRNFNGKIKILVEGNSLDFYKNVDESFKIINKLDLDKYEIYYLSYAGEPKNWYHVDHFLHKVPYEEVGSIYNSCDVLIKSSILESFSYPPLEMMATGGIVVARLNDGNKEYLVDGKNCIIYDSNNLDDAAKKIDDICNNSALREKLIKNGIETANKRNWKNIEKDIVDLYEGENNEGI